MEIANKKVLVIGLGLSGISTIKTLCSFFRLVWLFQLQ